MVNPERVSGLGTSSGDTQRMESNGLLIEERLPKTILQVNGASDAKSMEALAAAAGLAMDGLKPNMACSGDGSNALWNGPGMWMLVLEGENASMLENLNNAGADSNVTATDLSQSRTVLRISGERTFDFLATGCPVDLERSPDGSSLSTQFGHFNVLVHLVNRNTADLYVYRSFGKALWDHCHHIGEEFS